MGRKEYSCPKLSKYSIILVYWILMIFVTVLYVKEPLETVIVEEYVDNEPTVLEQLNTTEPTDAEQLDLISNDPVIKQFDIR